MTGRADVTLAVLTAVAGCDTERWLRVTWDRDADQPGELRHPAGRPGAIVETVVRMLDLGVDVRVDGVPHAAHDQEGEDRRHLRVWCLRVPGPVDFWDAISVKPTVVLTTRERDVALWPLREPLRLRAAAAANRWIAMCLRGDVRDTAADAPIPLPGTRRDGTSVSGVLHPAEGASTRAELYDSLAARHGLRDAA